MLARWVGVPSRIGYGFDGGERVDDKLEVRPRNGATFVEVYFPGYKWLPVIGTPKKAKPTVGSDRGQQQSTRRCCRATTSPCRCSCPSSSPPDESSSTSVRQGVLSPSPRCSCSPLVYICYPASAEGACAAAPARRGPAAGPRARIALAYAEWRDLRRRLRLPAPHRHAAHVPRPLRRPTRSTPSWRGSSPGRCGATCRTSSRPRLAAGAEELSRALRRRLAAGPARHRAGRRRRVAPVAARSLRARARAPTSRRKGEPWERAVHAA